MTTTGTRPAGRAAGMLLAWMLLAVWPGLGCGRGAPEEPGEAAGAAAAPAEAETEPLELLAEAVGDEETLAVGVVSLARDSAATIALELVLRNTSTEPGAIDLSQRFASAPPDRGTLADVYLAVTGTNHGRKLFVLRDADERPDTSSDLTSLRAGQQTVVRARFPAPPDDARELEIHVPHVPAMRVRLAEE